MKQSALPFLKVNISKLLDLAFRGYKMATDMYGLAGLSGRAV
jgi:hypothetical protein